MVDTPVLSFIDLETGGLDEKVHAVVEVAVVKTTPSGEHLSATVIPIHSVIGKRVDIEAFNLHGLDGTEGQHPAAAYEEVGRLVSGTILAGYNLQFDKRFLRQLADDVGAEQLSSPPATGRFVLYDHHELDVAASVMPLWLMGVVPAVNLHKVAAALGVKVWGPEHRALNDCLTTIEVYRAILARHGMAMRG